MKLSELPPSELITLGKYIFSQLQLKEKVYDEKCRSLGKRKQHIQSLLENIHEEDRVIRLLKEEGVSSVEELMTLEIEKPKEIQELTEYIERIDKQLLSFE